MPQGASNKKKYTYVWVSAVVLVFGIFTVVEVSKRFRDDTVVDKNRMMVASNQDELAFVVSDGQKRTVPPFLFINQDSSVVSNKDYLGKVYVVDFFFTTCPTICPIMTQNLADIQNTFKDEADFGIASFTINPRYDTPEVLRKYQEKYGVKDALDWNFLTGDQDKIYALARQGFTMYVNEQQAAPGGFEHSGLFALIDKEGNFRSRTDRYGNPLIYYRGTITEAQGTNNEGEAQQITMLKEDIKRLLEE
ncbi:MAG: SCO family protein [Croceivirga sp.]